MTANIELRDAQKNTVLWANPYVTVRDEYDATASRAPADAVIDPSAFFNQETNAVVAHYRRVRADRGQLDSGSLLIGARLPGRRPEAHRLGPRGPGLFDSRPGRSGQGRARG